MPKDEVLIAMERKRYHERLLQTGTLAINANGVATNADKAFGCYYRPERSGDTATGN